MSRQLPFWLGKGEASETFIRLTSSIFFIRFAGGEMQVPGQGRVRLRHRIHTSQYFGGRGASKNNTSVSYQPLERRL
jgi:hypothetical protein